MAGNEENESSKQRREKFLLNSGQIFDLYSARASNISINEVVAGIVAQTPFDAPRVASEIDKLDAIFMQAIRHMSPVPKPDPFGAIPNPTSEQVAYAKRLGMNLQEYLMTEYFACIALTGRKMDL